MEQERPPEAEPDAPSRRGIEGGFGARTRWWYVACLSHELGARPVARTVLGVPIVLFRDAKGQVAAVLDRCPHRNVPLSMGTVVRGELQCGYHGWKFDGTGTCTHVPALVDDAGHKSRNVPRFAAREQQGLVWVYPTAHEEPTTEPFQFRYVDDRSYLTVRREVRASGSLHAMAENALDVPHTAFLHRGLFRQDRDRNPIRCVVQRWHDRVECEYIGEPRPEGIAARILSPSGGVVTHFDRFVLPSIVEVEYRLGDENHILLNGACTPVTERDTRMFAVVSVKSRVPHWLVKPLVTPLAVRVFGQDARMLGQQTATIEHFGGEEKYVSTELDVLGPHILRLIRRAARGDLGDPDAQPHRKELTMLV